MFEDEDDGWVEAWNYAHRPHKTIFSCLGRLISIPIRFLSWIGHIGH